MIKLNPKESLCPLGREMMFIQEDLKEKQKKEAINDFIDLCLNEELSIEHFLDEIKADKDSEEIQIIHNLYVNAPKKKTKYERELLTIAKNIAYAENIYHYNEVYGIVAYLCNMGLTAENLYIYDSPDEGVYTLKSAYSGKTYHIVIKNRKTKWMFSRKGPFNKDSFAGLCDYTKVNGIGHFKLIPAKHAEKA